MKKLPLLETETVKSFADRIRRRFPREYDDVPDDRLVKEWLKKYPQYQARFAAKGQEQEQRNLPPL